MPTTIIRRPYTNIESAGLVPIAPTDTERRLLAHPGLERWVDAEHGAGGSSIRCRKSDALMLPAAAMPTRVTAGAVPTAYNGKAAYQFGTGGSNGRMLGAGWIPNGSFTIQFVGRVGPSPDTAFLFGTNTGNPVVANPGFGTFFRQQQTGNFDAWFDGAKIGATSSYQQGYTDGPNIVSIAWDDATKTASWRVNRGAASGAQSGLTDAEVEGRDLQIGAAGATGSGTIDDGDFAAVMVWNLSLDAAANEGLRTEAEAYLAARFGTP